MLFEATLTAKRLTAGVAALIVLVGAIAIAGYGWSTVRASHTDPSEVHLCVSRYTGEVRHVQNPAQCTGGYYVVTVNQQGAVGPQGPQGPPGPAGPAGPAGSPGGVAGYERVADQGLIEVNNTFAVGVADCGTKFVLGGGAGFFLPSGWGITESYPLDDHNWAVRAEGPALGAQSSFGVYAVCADATP